MLYRDRKCLAILTLTEDRDYVTCDELIQALEERPSNTVYIERDGVLCGLVVSGRIKRNIDEKKRNISFNRKYTYVHPGEAWRARQIFADKAVRALPVVSTDGRLLGDYLRSDDLVSTDFAELLCKDPYVLQGLKVHAQNAVFVRPAACKEGASEDKLFSWCELRLAREGIHLQVIQHSEIKNHLSTAEYFLFATEDEVSGIETLFRYLYQNAEAADKSFLTITDYLYRMRRLADVSFLTELQNQGVFILPFDFTENSNHFLAALNNKIAKRNEKYGVNLFTHPEEFRKSFADELYCETYKSQVFPLSVPVVSSPAQSGVPHLSDVETEFVHVQNGERLTTSQPKQYDRCIYLYGGCSVFGAFVPDQYTLPSLLQSEMNQAGFSCKVVNIGFPAIPRKDRNMLLTQTTTLLKSLPFKRGDIVVLDQHALPIEIYPILNLTNALERHNAPVDWFVDDVRHCNHKANQVLAHEIYKELVPALQQPPGERIPIELDHDYIDYFYLRHYFSDFEPAGHGTIGSIVMTCNPFTLGHRFLIEETLKAVDFLIIFVVEEEREDDPLFSFQERFAMVCQATSDLERVMVVPTGTYWASRSTYPEYFQRESSRGDIRKNAENDPKVFSEKIAPKLGITYRFVGEEPFDSVTHEYNEAMKRVLPLHGIQLVEIPRKANSQSIISAKRVRYCLSMNLTEELDELVPASIKRMLLLEE